jgi:hypothetical protein
MSKELDWAVEFRDWAKSHYWDFAGEKAGDELIERIESLLTAKEDALRKDCEAVIMELMDYLPDGPHYQYAWDECMSEEQEKVKEVRDRAREFLALLTTKN